MSDTLHLLCILCSLCHAQPVALVSRMCLFCPQHWKCPKSRLFFFKANNIQTKKAFGVIVLAGGEVRTPISKLLQIHTDVCNFKDDNIPYFTNPDVVTSRLLLHLTVLLSGCLHMKLFASLPFTF